MTDVKLEPVNTIAIKEINDSLFFLKNKNHPNKNKILINNRNGYVMPKNAGIQLVIGLTYLENPATNSTNANITFRYRGSFFNTLFKTTNLLIYLFEF